MAAADYDFELVVSRKLLLSIFCLIVVLFGLVYFFGYSAGYDRARTDQESAVAAVQPIEQSGDSVQLPDALLTDAPEVSPRLAADSGARGAKKADEPAAGNAPDDNPVPAVRIAADPERGAAVSAKPRPFREPKPPEPVPASGAPASAGISVAAGASSIHVQVAARQVRLEAERIMGELKAKGYPATLLTKSSDEWHRVLVGPFNSTGAAREYQNKLSADGFDSIVRQP